MEGARGATVVRGIAYGAGPEQVGDLYLPDGAAPAPVVVLIHGGFWRHEYLRDLMAPMAEDLRRSGVAVWNVEYRRVGPSGGGWPTTFDDVAAAIDHVAALADEHPLDLDRVTVSGHSAGGHLALWAAGRPRLGAGAPGARPAVRACAAVSLAGVAALVAAHEAGVGGSAVADLLGAPPSTSPERYAVASPMELGVEAPAVLVHGEADTIVPAWQSTTFSERHGAQYVPIDGDHFAVIAPTDPAWPRVREAILRACEAP